MCEFKISCVFIADRTVVRGMVGVCVIGNKHKKKLRKEWERKPKGVWESGRAKEGLGEITVEKRGGRF